MAPALPQCATFAHIPRSIAGFGGSEVGRHSRAAIVSSGAGEGQLPTAMNSKIITAVLRLPLP